jgi:hypothetical protein
MGEGVLPLPLFIMEFYFSFGKKPRSEKQRLLQAAVGWGILDWAINFVTNWLNKKILAKYDLSYINAVFNELDIFWLRNGDKKMYSESDIRLIIAIFCKALDDNIIERKELIQLIDFIQKRWAPETALTKDLFQADEFIEATIESTLDIAIDTYSKKYLEQEMSPEEFVLSNSTIIVHEPDGSEVQELLGGPIQRKANWLE